MVLASKSQLRVTKNPKGISTVLDQIKRVQLTYPPDDPLYIFKPYIYCKHCGRAIRYHKTLGGWVHVYSRISEPYVSFLEDQASHEIEVEKFRVFQLPRPIRRTR